ncbi:MAG: CBS domain-containing protein [Sulfolobales archaeon]|nr:CBS domain-containing protein [Sulfolobales archaeon]MCX8185620.1 CBS domain-containing protein [Sulfolobales archaeon]MDW7969563.1 CBS domain-containing protein [Sulfolobales archaeon]
MSVIPSSDEIKRMRLAVGLTQKELAKLAGVSQSLIARIEKGSVNPRMNTLRKILDAINKMSKTNETVEKIMTTPVIYVYVNTPLSQVIDIMDTKGISQVPVLDINNRIVGMIYESTLVKILKSKKDLKKLIALDVLEPPPPQIPKETPISLVESLLLNYPAILIVDKEGVKGITTKIDLIKYYIKS